MADKTIGELPALETMEIDTLIPVEHDGSAKSMSGGVLGDYVYGLVEADVAEIAQGPQGEPGVSPALSSSKTGKVTTIYFTDADHPTQTVLATLNDGADGTGVGDMVKSTYDQDADGIVDDAEKLGGQLPSYYQTAITANGVLQGNGSGTITAKEVDTAPSSNSTNLITSGGVYNAVKRTDAIDAANTSYSTKMARAIYATTTDLTAGSSSLTSGVICVVYEA